MKGNYDGPELRIEATEFCTRLRADLCGLLLLKRQLLSSSSTGIPLTPQFSRSTKPANEPTIPHFLQVTTYIPHMQTFRNFFLTQLSAFSRNLPLFCICSLRSNLRPHPHADIMCTSPSTARSTTQPTECLPNSPRANPLRRE